MEARAIRIYDKKAGKMVYPKEGTTNGVFVGMDGCPMQFDGEKFFKLDECIVMYDTGLRAVGGVPIWEADICEADVPYNFSGITSFSKARGIMVWNNQQGRWFLKMPQSAMRHGNFQVTNTKVIGNIYENKNLITDEIKRENK